MRLKRPFFRQLSCTMSISPTESRHPSGPGNPFAADVCAHPLLQPASVTGLHEDILAQVLRAVAAPAGGPLMLLTAPRAGYGKTHLLTRVVAAAGAGAVMVPVGFRAGDALTLTTLSRRGWEALDQAGGERAGWSRLREVCAGALGFWLAELIQAGKLACTNPEQARRVLVGSAAEVFDERGRASLIGAWLKLRIPCLRSGLSRLAGARLALPAAAVEPWIGRLLAQAFGETAPVWPEVGAAEAIPVWLRLVGVWRPVVLLVDHLDSGLDTPGAGVRLAALLLELVDAHGMHVLLSLNQDRWQAAFGSHLPSALEDRLTASRLELRGLAEPEARALLRLRLGEAGTDSSAGFEAFVDLPGFFGGQPAGGVSARAFLRYCAHQWARFMDPLPALAEPAWEAPPAVDTPVSSQAGAVPPPSAAAVTPSAEAMRHLQAMVEALQQPASDSPVPAGPLPDPAPEWPPPVSGEAGLAERFERLREALRAEASSRPLDRARVADLLRLAGRRFPLVAFSEHELPGLTGRQTLCWSLQGLEILFGLGDFDDADYWRVLAGFAAGRLAELARQAEVEGGEPARLKLVLVHSARDAAALQSLLDSGVLPEPLRGCLDPVLVDDAGIAELYAVQRIIHEAETGSLAAAPTEVLQVLAHELDFFWQRVTRAD